MEPLTAYRSLLKKLGPQGWWPVAHEREHPTYHPGDYSFPRTPEQAWEICVGAILTQNTAWTNVEKALAGLREKKLLFIDALLNARKTRLARAIRSSGYYNQKALKLKALAQAVKEHGSIAPFLKAVTREELLDIRGVGPETADSILLYAAKRPFFVVDAYTRRLFSGNFFAADARYEDIRNFFESSLPRSRKLYNEFHALIVHKAKARTGKGPQRDATSK